MSALEAADASGSWHADRVARPEPGLTLGDTTLKWYDVARDDATVPLATRVIARRCLRDAARDGTLGDLGELGFAVLQRCDEDFYTLLVCTWRNESELTLTAWAKDDASDALFRPWTVDRTHRSASSVPELGVVGHEREARSRYLRSARDDAARQAYLRDSCSGLV